MDGVIETEVGFIGGEVADATYKQVCSGETGHAEAVHLVFDPEVVSYESLMQIFWDNHDPTQVNRQGPDVGTQYRSAIFYHSEEQRLAAQASKEKLGASGRYNAPIATQIVAAADFVRAEEYHQQYYEKQRAGLRTD